MPAILIIDDDPVIGRVVCNLLADYGFRLFVAQDGDQGLRLAERHVPDLILLDLSMPGADGLEVCRRLKADPVTAPISVVFFSVSNDLEEKVMGFQLGALDFITKPVEPRELIARVMVQLRKHIQVENLRSRLAAYQHRFGLHTIEAGPDDVHPVRRIDHIRRARQILEARLKDPPSLAELADAVHLSPKRLSRDFQVVYGMTAFAWLREYRLLRAAELLRTSDAPMSVIADRLGYGSAASFSTQFRQHFGLSPRDYRAAQGLG